MTHRIAVSSKVPDARAANLLKHLQNVFPESGVSAAFVVQLYTADAQLTEQDLEHAAAALTNPLTEVSSTTDVSAAESYAYAIEIGFLPGVTDNVGHTAKETIEDLLRRKFKEEEGVYSSYVLFLRGDISAAEAELMAGELYNPLIERAAVFPHGEAIPITVPRVKLHAGEGVTTVDLHVSDAELAKIGKEGIKGKDGTRRGPLALSVRALEVIRGYFDTEGRNPTDVELESLAQTWSEHCKHTIFSDPLDEVKDGIYRRYIKGATEKIRKQKGKKDFCVSVFTDNSGAIALDEKYLITHKVETHNAPSALDPYGGSVTAVVGVNRDALGFGLGAKPIANVYGFCVADPRDMKKLFRDRSGTKPLLPARRILEGVIKGINAGGNQSGIPTPLGFVLTDESYRGKPLIYGGTIGLIPRLRQGTGGRGAQKLYEKRAKAGDYIVMAGGRVGLDGIHGATFSSESLSKGSPATAVQIGDPITQKKLSDALIREARDLGLYSSITDDGAGGLSGSIGEMAKESGGCEVDLETIPLKYPGLDPWQIWLSESQERMTLAVPKAKWTALKKIFDRHGVEATRVGTFTESGRCVVREGKKVVMDMDIGFLHDGRPIEIQKSKKPSRAYTEPSKESRSRKLGETLLEMLARPSIGSTAFIAQQYDHTVQGTAASGPLAGRGRVNADAGVLRPLADSKRGIVLSYGIAPWYSQVDTYAMAAAAIDTAVRNAICAGASRDYLAILDNFCWSSSEKPERLYELKEAAHACYDTAIAYGTPFISGKDSMYNDFRGFDEKGRPVHIAALPTLLISAIGVVSDVEKTMTPDFKHADDALYLIGETNDELGASEYYSMLGATGKKAPTVDTKKNIKAYDALSKAISQGIVASAIGLGRGGLAVALAKACTGGQVGARADLSGIPGKAKLNDSILFSESQGRVLVSIRPTREKEFEKLLRGVPFARIGETGGSNLVVQLSNTRVETSIPALSDAYQSFFKEW
ncbi:phosphoribosylformylglycinamidine synthase [Candidatus Kaiserbacteria bacterium]|nr:phosphoribosylformylglycinamidine synthase [Candidatus Kaiserbacteria bacterium]